MVARFSWASTATDSAVSRTPVVSAGSRTFLDYPIKTEKEFIDGADWYYVLESVLHALAYLDHLKHDRPAFMALPRLTLEIKRYSRNVYKSS